MVKPLNKNMKSDDLYYYGGVSEGLVVFTFPLTRGQDWFAKAGQYCKCNAKELKFLISIIILLRYEYLGIIT